MSGPPTVVEPLVKVDDRPSFFGPDDPIGSRIEVPPRAQSSGWGDMSWLHPQT